MNIAVNLERSARRYPERPAIVSGDRAVSYQALEAAASRTASGLAELGVRTGDRVALYLPNIPEFAVAYLAAQKLGAIAVSLNVMLLADEMRYALEDSGAKVLFTGAEQWPRVEPLVGSLPDLGQVVICEGAVEGHPTMEELGAGRRGEWPAASLGGDTPASILYTSGTTGRQKGATLSHGNLVTNTASSARILGLGADDKLLLFLPLFHCFGQNFILNSALKAGAAVVLQRRFRLADAVEAVEREGITVFCAVPTVYIQLLEAAVSAERFRSVRRFFSAAATMPTGVASRWRTATGYDIHEGYGLTETSPSASYNHESRYRPGTVGTPIEQVEMKVVDEEDREVAAGQWGEIVVRGPNVMLGYWNSPAETERALRGGWLHTGDIGYADDEGYFHVVDRSKDMINCAGFKIWPRELEDVLYQHPDVEECAVVGALDAVYGEVVRAFIVPKANARVAVADIQSYCRSRVAAYKAPREVTFVRELPRSPSGKILKRVLRGEPRSAGPAASAR